MCTFLQAARAEMPSSSGRHWRKCCWPGLKILPRLPSERRSHDHSPQVPAAASGCSHWIHCLLRWMVDVHFCDMCVAPDPCRRHHHHQLVHDHHHRGRRRWRHSYAPIQRRCCSIWACSLGAPPLLRPPSSAQRSLCMGCQAQAATACGAPFRSLLCCWEGGGLGGPPGTSFG